MYIGCVLSFMKFEGQTSKNVHDVRKVCIKITMCVDVWFVDFYVFIADEILLKGPKLVYEYVWVWNFPKDNPTFLKKWPMFMSKTAQDSPTH